jgi:hypothetical protein
MANSLKIKTKPNRLSNHLAPVQAMNTPYINFQVSAPELEYETNYHSLNCCLWNILAYFAMCYEQADIFQLHTLNCICKIHQFILSVIYYQHYKQNPMYIFTGCQCWWDGKVGGGWYNLPGPGYVVYVFVFLGSIIICRLWKLTL